MLEVSFSPFLYPIPFFASKEVTVILKSVLFYFPSCFFFSPVPRPGEGGAPAKGRGAGSPPDLREAPKRAAACPPAATSGGREPFKSPAPRGTRRSRLAEPDQRPWAGPAPSQRPRVPPPRRGRGSRPAGAHARSPQRKESAHTPARPPTRAAAPSPVRGGLSARRDSKSCGRQGAVRTQGGCGGAGLWKMPPGGASVRCSCDGRSPPTSLNPLRPPGKNRPAQ